MGLSARLAEYPAFSWRSDPTIPPFSDEHPLIVFDGVCVLCSRFARFVARRDRASRFKFVAAQSPLGQALMRHYNLDTVDLETNLLIADGRASAKLEAVAGVLEHLGEPWRLAARFMLRFPRPLRDWLYDRVARNRYRLFGRYDACVVPGPEWRERMLGLNKE